MSKKLAAGSDCIVLDVKTGSGAFMKNLEDSISLAREDGFHRDSGRPALLCLITNMDVPLGHAIGNSLEMEEAIETLKGRGPEDLTCVCLELAANMLHMAGRGGYGTVQEDCPRRHGGWERLKCLKSMVESQAGMAVTWKILDCFIRRLSAGK